MKNILLLGYALLFCFCTNPLPKIKTIDLSRWKADRHGCSGYRSTTAAELLSQKEKLLGLTENQILELLGKPDAVELYRRNQKFYYYSLAADSTCSLPARRPQKLSLYFNATGRVKEVIRQ